MKGASAVATLLALIICGAWGACVAAQPAPEPATGNYTPAKVLDFPEMQWPGGIDREALVFVRYTVSPKGKVTEAEPILDKGFYDRNFLAAATKVVRSMRFAPSKLDGKPVEFTAVMPVKYGMSGVGGLGRAFRNEWSRVESLFKQGDYLGADHHAEAMLRDTVKNHMEFAALKVALATTHSALGQDDLALRFAEDATMRNLPNTEPFALHGPLPPNKAANYTVTGDVLKSMLEMRMRLNTRHGMLVEARQAYDELAGLEAISPDDPRALVAAQITEKLAGNDPLGADGKIWDEKPWHHVLIRNHFWLDKVEGEMDSVLLTCGSKQQKLDYVPGEEWSVPQGWRDCSVAVAAEPGSTFRFVETVD
jgi:hypothetical protein